MPVPPKSALLPTPLTGWPLAVLIGVYLLVGMGHVPWRGDDLTYLGPIHAILTDGSWLIPSIAGEPFYEYPPLYYWLGAVLARAFGWLMPVHDAARLASSLCAAATLYWTGLAARRLYGDNTGAPAILLGLGSLGLVVHAHETQPLLAQLAGMALCYAGLADMVRRPWAGARQAGIGAGLTFLAGGLPGMFVTLPLFFAMPLLCDNCRNGAVPRALAGGLVVALLLGGSWPALLGWLHPEALASWWNDELAASLPHGNHLQALGKMIPLLGWFAWPLWPIAGWALWKNRRALNTPPVALPIIASLLAMVAVVTTGPLRPASTLPILPPLCLLAALGVGTLRRGAANALDWFAIMAFAFFAILVWIGWSALYFGWPPGLGRQLARLAPDLVRSPSTIAAVTGMFLSLALFALPVLTTRSTLRGATNWAIGMTLLWCLAVALWQPWFEHTKNYAPVAQALARELELHPAPCITRKGLNDTQRAALDYFKGIKTIHHSADQDCPAFLVYSADGLPYRPPGDWRTSWEKRLGGGRKTELFRLYRHD